MYIETITLSFYLPQKNSTMALNIHKESHLFIASTFFFLAYTFFVSK